MIRGLYDDSIAAYKTGTEQTENLLLDTLRLNIKWERRRLCDASPPKTRYFQPRSRFRLPVQSVAAYFMLRGRVSR